MLTTEKHFRYAFVFLALFLCLSFVTPQTSYGRTVITKTGPCAITITIKIEVWGENASQEVVDRWKKNIEAQWNGPTQDSIAALAQANGIIDPIDPSLPQAQQDALETANNDKLRANRDRLNKMYADMLKDLGMEPGTTMVDCCTVTIVADIKLRGEEAAEGYHQIEAVPSMETVEVDGKEVERKRRSFVRKEQVDGKWVLNGRNNSTSGRWRSDDPDWPPEAHECGHLMGLYDQYHDDAPDEQGHEADLMAHNLSWPHESGLSEIITGAGVTCGEECCPNETTMNGFFENYNRTAFAAGDAIAACNIPVMQQAKQDLEDQMKNMGLARMSMAKKVELYNLIKSKLDQINKAIEDCGKPRPTTGTSIGTDYGLGIGYDLNDFGLKGRFGLGTLGYTMGSDSTEFCTYAGGDGSTPIAPPTMTLIDPTDETPGSTPGSSSGSTPGTTPDSASTPTPGSTPGTTPTIEDIFSDGFESGDLSLWRDTTPSGGTVTGPGVTTNDGGTVFVPSDNTTVEKPVITYNGQPVPIEDIPQTTPNETPNEDTPQETPDETDDTPETTVPTVTYHIKAKDSVLQSDGTKLSQDMGGQRIKLIDPSLVNPQLAMGDNNKVDEGYDQNPNQCTTNNNGDCDIKIPLNEILLKAGMSYLPEENYMPSPADGSKGPNDGTASTPASGNTPQPEINIEVIGNKVNSQNMIVPTSEVDSLPAEVIEKASSSLTVGDHTYLTYTSGYSMGADYKMGLDLSLKYGLKYDFEENICGDEQPGPPIGTFIDTLGLAQNNDLPTAYISFPTGEIK